MSQNLLATIASISRIVISVFMLVLGGYLLIRGRLGFRKYSVKGLVVRIIGALILVASAMYFLYGQRNLFHTYTLLIQVVILLAGLLLLWILAEKPARQPAAARCHPHLSIRSG